MRFIFNLTFFYKIKFFIMKEKLLQLAKVPKRSSFFGLLALCLFLNMVFIADLSAQETLIKGKITALAGGDALPGVNILIDGTRTGTVTSTDGTYQINVPGPDAILIVSYIGFKTQNIPVGSHIQQFFHIICDSRCSFYTDRIIIPGGGFFVKFIHGSYKWRYLICNNYTFLAPYL